MPSDRQLQTWIEESQSHRQQLKVGVIVLAVLGVLVALGNRNIGLLMVFTAGFTAAVGMWITGSRITDWQDQLQRRRAAR
jgi:uncharacterized membrane protein YesL